MLRKGFCTCSGSLRLPTREAGYIPDFETKQIFPWTTGASQIIMQQNTCVSTVLRSSSRAKEPRQQTRVLAGMFSSPHRGTPPQRLTCEGKDSTQNPANMTHANSIMGINATYVAWTTPGSQSAVAPDLTAKNTPTSPIPNEQPLHTEVTVDEQV